MIEKRLFGVSVAHWNQTEMNSTIKFGGIDQDAIKKGHELFYFNTTSPDSWELNLTSVDFHGENIIAESYKALITPGWPFIGAPEKDFVKFKEAL